MEKIDAIMVKDKWGEHVVRAEDGTIESAAMMILKERLDQGFWYHGDTEKKARSIESRDAGWEAWEFLLARQDHEYEWVEQTLV